MEVYHTEVAQLPISRLIVGHTSDDTRLLIKPGKKRNWNDKVLSKFTPFDLNLQFFLIELQILSLCKNVGEEEL
jgi:hypothetical protein